MRIYLGPARLWSLVEATVAAILMFVPISQDQTAAILLIVAIATGERVTRKVRNTES